MIGSLDKQMVFLHNPKCAGCSMTTHLLTYCYFVPLYEGLETDGTGYGVINKHAYVVPPDYSHCMVIAGYRDPWSRWKSHFNYLYVNGLYALDFETFCKDDSYYLGLPMQSKYLERADYIVNYRDYNVFLKNFGFPLLDLEINKTHGFKYEFNDLSIKAKNKFIHYNIDDYRFMSRMGLIDKNFL